jgi:hypothetical protein
VPRSRTLLGPLLAAAVLAACATPSIPIPPPSPENMAFEVDADAGVASFSYRRDATYAHAIVYVFNRDAGEGIIATADGQGAVAATQPFPAEDGDEVVVTFELESQLASTCVVVADGPSSSGRECDL